MLRHHGFGGSSGPAVDTAADSTPEPSPPATEWPLLADEAYYGLAGELVRTIEPASEADPVALLGSFLIGFGNLVGRKAHFLAEADQHFANEFGVFVGQTSKGRKGTSWGHCQRVLADADQDWARDRIGSGLSSGEGLIWSVRDPITKRERVKGKGPPRYEDVEADPGIADKRLLVIEPEFASVLKRSEQQGNTLSAVARCAWDGRDLRSMTKNSPARASGAHVSLIGHITIDELRRYLTETEMANGFGNRFLWFCVRRSKVLPEGGQPDQAALQALGMRVRNALVVAQQVGVVKRDDEARTMWHSIYGQVSEGRTGLSGSLMGRAEAHVMRLAMLYALLDESSLISAKHLLAAVAVWDFVEESIQYVFGSSLGDPVADDLLRLVRSSKGGVMRTDVYAHFGRHVKAAQLGQAEGVLVSLNLIRVERVETGGRPGQRLVAVSHSAPPQR
jgi:hypothetical protein